MMKPEQEGTNIMGQWYILLSFLLKLQLEDVIYYYMESLRSFTFFLNATCMSARI
jgi:hypothetical protein